MIFNYCESCIVIMHFYTILDAKYWLKRSHLGSGHIPVRNLNAPLTEGIPIQVIVYSLREGHEMIPFSSDFIQPNEN